MSIVTRCGDVFLFVISYDETLYKNMENIKTLITAQELTEILQQHIELPENLLSLDVRIRMDEMPIISAEFYQVGNNEIDRRSLSDRRKS